MRSSQDKVFAEEEEHDVLVLNEHYKMSKIDPNDNALEIDPVDPAVSKETETIGGIER